MKKKTSQMYRYKLLLDTIDRLEQGKYTMVDERWCCDTISWLWKWRKISEEEMHSLCNRMIDIFNCDMCL